ncbi:hypothetical protein EVAR_76906_1 [Eumeta japonica]|uniref:Tesmin/TSO1-like CXC domain-containing protein n=1 Tax=Eumeta variegata TaxID=151549 RepID=A0A4C1SHM3_EUMVA|nr:hypothetical protein EVAR_76906_1 [Eumeta japonica]
MRDANEACARASYARRTPIAKVLLRIQRLARDCRAGAGAAGRHSVQNSKPLAPPELLKLIFCKCKGNCGAMCGCRKAGMKCSAVCFHCSGETCSNVMELSELINENDFDDEPPTLTLPSPVLPLFPPPDVGGHLAVTNHHFPPGSCTDGPGSPPANSGPRPSPGGRSCGSSRSPLEALPSRTITTFTSDAARCITFQKYGITIFEYNILNIKSVRPLTQSRHIRVASPAYQMTSKPSQRHDVPRRLKINKNEKKKERCTNSDVGKRCDLKEDVVTGIEKGVLHRSPRVGFKLTYIRDARCLLPNNVVTVTSVEHTIGRTERGRACARAGARRRPPCAVFRFRRGESIRRMARVANASGVERCEEPRTPTSASVFFDMNIYMHAGGARGLMRGDHET